MAAPQQWWSSTPTKGKIPKAQTPRPSDQKINYPLTMFRTSGAGGIELTSYDDGSNGLGICRMIKNQNGSGIVWDHGGGCEQRNECGSYVGTKGESVSYGNGNSMSSHDGDSTTRSAKQAVHSSTQGGGDASSSGGGFNPAVNKTSCDSSQMHTIGGSLGFVCGGTFGAAGTEVNIKSAGNMSCGSAGSLSVSGEMDCSIGSQSGCMHMFGSGMAFGSMKGDIAFQAGKTTNFTTAGQFVNKSGGNMYHNAPKIYLNSGAPIPYDTNEIAAMYGKSVSGAVKDSIPVRTI